MGIGTNWKKIDTDLVSTDGAGHAAIPVLVRRNTLDNYDDRTLHCTHGYPQLDSTASETQATDYLPEFSTHPDYFFTIPLLIPKSLSSDTINARISYKLADASMRWKFWVEGAESDGQTVTTSASVTQSKETATIDSTDVGANFYRAQLMFSSVRSAGTVTTELFLELLGVNAVLVNPSTSTVGKSHFIVDVTGPTDGDVNQMIATFHIPRVKADTAFDRIYDIWPSHDGPLELNPRSTTGKSDATTKYNAGKMTLYGFNIYYDNTSVKDDKGIVSKGSVGPGQEMQAKQPRSIDRTQRKLFADRGRWLICGPKQTTTKHWHNAYATGVATEVATGGLYYRDQMTGIRVGILWIPNEGKNGTGDYAVIEFELAFTTTAGTTTVTDSDVSGRIFKPREYPYADANAALVQHNIRTTPGEWGMEDLGFESDIYKYNYHEMFAEVPSGSSVGTTQATFTLDCTGHAAILAVSAVEVY